MPKTVRKIFFYTYLFLLIYTPALSASVLFDKYILLCVLLALGLLPYILRRRLSDLTLLQNKNVIILMMLVLLVSIYLMIVQIFNGVSISSISDTRLVQNNLVNILIVHAAIAIDQLKKLEISKLDAILLLSKFAILQGAYSLLSLVFPLFKSFSEKLYTLTGGENIFVIDARIFGISSDFTFGTPIYHGLLAAVLVYLSLLHKRPSFLLYLPFILAAVILNNRTGVIAFVVASLLLMLHAAIKKGKLALVILATVIACGSSIMLFGSLKNVSPSTYEFIDSFIEDTKNLARNNTTGNYDVLAKEFGDFQKYPPDILIGEGYRVYDETGEIRAKFRTDIGYLNDLYYGGLLYILLLYGGFVYFMLYNSKGYKYLFVVLLAVLLLVNIKGEIFRSNIVIFFFIYIKLVAQSKLKQGDAVRA